MEIMEKAYLKCDYSEGMFSNEYFVNFKGSLERGTGIGAGGDYAIMKDRLIVTAESSGLIPILIAKKEEKTSNILIDGAMEIGAGVFFTVPNGEILFNN